MASFHTATLQLLGSSVNTSTSAVTEVEQAEQKLALVLPPSVREWYCFDCATQILAECSNADPPIPASKFAIREWNSHRLIPIRFENQGVCEWAILLDGTDDPPVFVDVDSGGKEWQLLAHTFSAYVYSCVWDHRVVLEKPALVQAQNRELSEHTIGQLRAFYAEEIQTSGWPGSIQYRFSGNDFGVLIWTANGQADWFVGATNASALESALRTIWNLDDVGKAFYDVTPVGKEVLEKIRR